MWNNLQRFYDAIFNRQRNPQNEVEPFTDEEDRLVSDLVAAARRNIGNNVQVEASGDARLNTALLVLETEADPAYYCWNSYDLRPDRRRGHNLNRLRPLIVARLQHEAAQAGAPLAQLARVQAQDVDRNGLEVLR